MFRRSGFLSDMIRQADLVLLLFCCAASAFGLVMISSATRYMGSADSLRHVVVQGIAALLGIVLFFFFSQVDITLLAKKWKWVLGFNIVLILLLKTPLGLDVNGNLAWLDIPGFPVNIQPAEIVKLTFIVLLARQLVYLKEEKNLRSAGPVMQLAGHLLLIAGLYYVISSDMGSTLVYAFVFACMAFAAGLALRWFVIALLGGGFAFYVLWQEDKLPQHIVERFIVLFDHNYDPQGVGWHQTRSLLTLGGGKLLGQGLFNGTQTQSEFSWSLPFRHTDFIFSAIGEELGMLGCLLVVLLLTAIIVRCLATATKAKSRMESYICVGIAGTLIFQSIANIGMCLFVMPVIGLTLPFFSYGGSSILTIFMAMGIVSGIRSRSLPEWLRKT